MELINSNLEIFPQLLANSLITGSLYALLGAGLALSYGILRILNFAHGHLTMVGAYLFLFFVNFSQFYSVSAFVLIVLTLLLISELVLKIFINPFLRYGYLLVFITTLTLSTMLESAVAMLFGVNVHSLNVYGSNFNLFGVYITSIQIIIILSSILILTFLALLVNKTPLGRKMKAISYNSSAAAALGIDTIAITRIVFALSVLLAGYAGILIGMEANLQPTMGNSYTIKAFAAMILGGLGHIWGAVLGGYILGVIENFAIGIDFGTYSIPAGYKDSFAFIVLLIVLLVRPQGIMGVKGRSS